MVNREPDSYSHYHDGTGCRDEATGNEGQILTVPSRATATLSILDSGQKHLRAVGQSLHHLQLSTDGAGRRLRGHRQLISPPTDTTTGSYCRVKRHISDQLAHTRSVICPRSPSGFVTEQEPELRPPNPEPSILSIPL